MRVLVALLQKEFLQIFRNRTLLPMIFIMPLVQLIVLVNAATMDIKNIRVTMVDMDLSTTSRLLASQLEASHFFSMGDMAIDKQDGLDLLQDNKTDVVIYIPHQLEKHVQVEGRAGIQVITDAIDATKARLAYAYITNIVRDINQNILVEQGGRPMRETVSADALFWFNPELNFKYYMLPAVMVILVTLIGMFLSALNLVREKEVGTAEQINVTPIRKTQFILGKLIPFLIIGLLELSFGIIASVLIYKLPVNGNLLVLYTFAALYLVAVLGIGLFISTKSQTQQQVMMISFFFMLVFVLLSGAFTSVDNMPQLVRSLNRLNPMFYFMNVIRGVLLKGAGFSDLLVEFRSILIFASFSLGLAVLSYRKTS